MMYPVFLSLPSIIGVICGTVFLLGLWDTHPLLGIFVGVTCLVIGLWFSTWLEDKFFD